ncbi:MAG: hypothetical protein K2W95_15815 [Candidatus Obscuribacterales bacterium]|nr:hypothetical protein [Candidatus Obscuribacterales bacterium]
MLVEQQSRKLRKLGELLDQVEQGQTACDEEWRSYQRTISQSLFNQVEQESFLTMPPPPILIR